MARRRKASTVRRTYRAAPKRAKRRSGTSSKVKLIQPTAMAYGTVRGTMATLIAPLTSKLGFLGQISDEVGLGVANYLLAKNTSGMIKNAAIDGLKVENAMLGLELARGGLSLFGVGQGNSDNDSSFYG